MPIEKIKDHLLGRIETAAQAAFGQPAQGLAIVFPPDLQFGHLAVGCFPLAKPLRKSPAEIAKTIAAAVTPDDIIAAAAAAGPYINFTLHPAVLFGEVLAAIAADGGRYGQAAAPSGRSTVTRLAAPPFSVPN